eukprot:TRINITY_DN6243_c0_g2_i9.p1 TRINITY_DN6243_c0_g2~~TRINITY_DN6243_c0_g2_i9.p1  ORF type:complete len:1079 (+),score=142.38 TRINITY_DN6243_c0_g2_i9:161-3238(+)
MALIKLSARFLSWAVELATYEDEPQDTRMLKKVVVPMLGVLAILLPVGAVMRGLLPPDSVEIYGDLTMIAAVWIALALMFRKDRGSTVWQFQALTCLGVAGLFVRDGAQAADMEERSWHCVALILVFCTMTVAMRDSFANTLIYAGTLLWIVADNTEAASRFGLYDILSSSDGLPARCACSDPPCSVSASKAVYSLFESVVFVSVLVAVVQWAAADLRRAHQYAVTVAEIAEDIAVSLSDFDLSRAEALLKLQHSNLPSGLRDTLFRLLSNLRTYQQYLPQECLVISESLPSDDESVSVSGAACDRTVSAPSMLSSRLSSLRSVAELHAPHSEDVTIVFTDVEGSTELWDKFPVGMQRALVTHNSTLRKCVAEYTGYEVKVIGDSFMTAFGSAVSAVGCVLFIQEQLCDQIWPTEILSLPRCAREYAPGTRTPIWGGLRVRAGVHCGTARREDNPVTGRADYFGQTVNTAARVEAAATVGGMVCVTGPVLRKLRADQGMAVLGSPKVVDLGVPEMKGVSDPPPIYALFSQRLVSRADDLKRAREERLRRQELRRSSTEQAVRMQKPAKLHLSVATLAEIRAKYRVGLESDLGSSLSSVVSCADSIVDRTGGSVTLLIGNSVLAAWGAAGRPCPQHAVQSARAAFMLSAGSVCNLHAFGAATGPVMHGSVGTAKHRYVLTLGPCHELAQKLARAAERLGTLALIAGCCGEACAAEDLSIKHSCRTVDFWAVTGPEPGHVAVYELDTTTASDEGAWSGMLRDKDSEGSIRSRGTWGNDEWHYSLARAFGLRMFDGLGLASAHQSALSRTHTRISTGDDAMTNLRIISGVIKCTRCGADCFAHEEEPPSGLCRQCQRISGRVSGGGRTPPGTPIQGVEDVVLRVLANAASGSHAAEVPMSWICPLPSHGSAQWHVIKGDRRGSRRRSQSFMTQVSRGDTSFRQRAVLDRSQNAEAWGSDSSRRRSNSGRMPVPGGRRRSGSVQTSSTLPRKTSSATVGSHAGRRRSGSGAPTSPDESFASAELRVPDM